MLREELGGAAVRAKGASVPTGSGTDGDAAWGELITKSNQVLVTKVVAEAGDSSGDQHRSSVAEGPQGTMLQCSAEHCSAPVL